jgi:hypothetical protein
VEKHVGIAAPCGKHALTTLLICALSVAIPVWAEDLDEKRYLRLRIIAACDVSQLRGMQGASRYALSLVDYYSNLPAIDMN